MIERTNYQGIFNLLKWKRRILLTKNLTPGISFFKERLHEKEYREFEPTRSKIAAALLKRINFFPVRQGDKVLYLGAAHGYTASFLSDIVGKKGMIFCLDFAPRVVRDLYLVCEVRENMIPLLADANKPETYKERIQEVDVLVQDLAQKRQVEILFKNLQFLKGKGYVLLAVKARSIDVTKKPKNVFKEVEYKLKERVKIIDSKELSPLEKDHKFYVCQKK